MIQERCKCGWMHVSIRVVVANHREASQRATVGDGDVRPVVAVSRRD
jgi:hypothetical protein